MDNHRDASWLIQIACKRNSSLRICESTGKPERNFDPGDFFAETESGEEEAEDDNDGESVGLSKYVSSTEKNLGENSFDRRAENGHKVQDMQATGILLPAPTSRTVQREKLLEDIVPEYELKTAKEPLNASLPAVVEKSNRTVKEGLVDLNAEDLQSYRGGNKVSGIENTNGQTVLVAVSSFCINTREKFVKKCHGKVDPENVEFCQKYPLACEVTRVVIPVLTYCRRYYKHFAKFCDMPDKITEGTSDFCIAFARYCLPTESADRIDVNHIRKPSKTNVKSEVEVMHESDSVIPKTKLRRCEDVVEEARKICNPFPPPEDRFNYFRCSQFFKSCKRFVDWI